MKIITKYQARDGKEFSTESACASHENTLAAVESVMLPLGSREKANERGWIQHAPIVVANVKRELLRLARPTFAGHYPKITDAIDNNPDSIHPHSIVGRILDDMDSPLNDGWRRLCCIDEQGREHNQPYFALNGPDAAMVCNEDRR